MTLLVMSIIAAGALMAWPKDQFSVSAQAESIASDIRYTQALSIANNSRYRINLTNSTQYSILDSGGTAVTIPSVNATTASLATGMTISTSINYLVFDSRGVPYSSSTNNGSGTVLSSDLTITVSGTMTSKQIVVTAETGRVYVQ